MIYRNFSIAALGSAFLLSACVPAIETAEMQVTRASVAQGTINSVQATVREMMKDPESTKFRNTVTYRSRFGDQIVCGEYDAKNSYGGYTGYDSYYFRMRDGVAMAKHVDTSANDYYKPAFQACQSASQGKVPVPAAQISQQ